MCTAVSMCYIITISVYTVYFDELWNIIVYIFILLKMITMAWCLPHSKKVLRRFSLQMNFCLSVLALHWAGDLSRVYPTSHPVVAWIGSIAPGEKISRWKWMDRWIKWSIQIRWHICFHIMTVLPLFSLGLNTSIFYSCCQNRLVTLGFMHLRGVVISLCCNDSQHQPKWREQ